MGNCQAIDAASLVIQHPCGKVDRLYWSVTADEIMKSNPGHYVALLIRSTTLHQPQPATATATAAGTPAANGTIRLTRVKLLKPTDTLVVGQIYRLIGTQEVMKGLMAKKHARMKKNQAESARGIKPEKPLKQQVPETGRSRSEEENTNQVTRHENIQRQKPSTSGSSAMARLKTWQPSLQSILEAGS